MSSYKIIKYIINPMLLILGMLNLYILATQELWILGVWIIEVIVMRYLVIYKKYRSNTYQEFRDSIIFWSIPIIVYFLSLGGRKSIYVFIFDQLNF